jgi:beta-N-acetylhexosaminidase
LRHAARRRLLDPAAVARSRRRVEALRRRLGAVGPRPALDAVGSKEHLALARTLAERSITVVRDDAGLLPLRLDADARILAVMPRPEDLTPADTSSTVTLGLAAALRRVHSAVDELLIDGTPSDAEIASVRARAIDAGAVVVGTIAAEAGGRQARLVEGLLATGRPVVTVALRTPWDLLAYPGASTHLCTYGILPASLEALAGVLFGRIAPSGRLPVPLGDLYPVGHGL